jgi:hypothetical protein
MNDNTILRIKVPANLYESVKKQLTLKESKNRLSEAISGTDEELMAFYEKVKQMEAEGTDLESAISYAKFDIENPDAAKELSSMNEAKKSGHNYGAGMEVVKEKKMKTPKDGMKKVEEMKHDKKDRSLDELKAVKAKLDKKIHEMENTSKENMKEYVGMSPDQVELVNTLGQLIAGGAASATVIAAAKNLLSMIKGSKKPMDNKEIGK